MYPIDRWLATLEAAIYHLLAQDTFSQLHRLTSDEVFHHYMGSPVEMLRLWPDGAADVVVLGTGLAATSISA